MTLTAVSAVEVAPPQPSGDSVADNSLLLYPGGGNGVFPDWSAMPRRPRFRIGLNGPWTPRSKGFLLRTVGVARDRGSPPGTLGLDLGTRSLSPALPAMANAVGNGPEVSADSVPMRIVVGNRALNATVATLGLVLSSPLFLAIAVAIKLSSPGSVIYTQKRVGLDVRVRANAEMECRRGMDLGGRPFTIYKFRTMRVDAERESGAVWAVPEDPRVTSVGRFLRRYRLDELPQLINVLRCEMNIVGPRPERPAIFKELRQQIPQYALRQRAMPGITGLAQINHHYDRDIDDVRIKLRHDLSYVQQQSVWMDLKIMVKTVPAVLISRRGW